MTHIAPNPTGSAKTLRRRLFGSHLLVMVVALGVLLAGLAVFITLYEVSGSRGNPGRGGGGPLGLLFGSAAAILASAFVSWRVARRLAEPLEAIGSATRQLAVGRYDIEVPKTNTAELDQLASDVNVLATELKTSEDRRLRLIGDVAHELRNPLSTIEGTMEALLDGVVEAEPDTFARIGREAARLRRLADDLSSLSAAGEFDVSANEQVHLGDVLRVVVAQLEPQAVAQGLELSVVVSDELIVRGDTDRLLQVFTNVIGNAVQYTNDGGVSVQVIGDGRLAVIEVADTGRGLAEDDLVRVFERFHRVDGHFSDGTGVGLAIAKLIVEAHQGRITATSDGIGAGSVFRIELPVSGEPSVDPSLSSPASDSSLR